MPDLRTEATELGTALGTIGIASLDEALLRRPSELIKLSGEHWDRLESAVVLGQHRDIAKAAFANGQAFFEAKDGLRGRCPIRVEWKGPHKPPGYDLLPADLRIDHVYLISCKYSSRLLMNASPASVFEGALQVRGSVRAGDWYMEVAEESYRDLYEVVRLNLGESLPTSIESLTQSDRDLIKLRCQGKWPLEILPEYMRFSDAVASATAKRWLRVLSSLRESERMLWRMLRLSDSPYFILGTDVRSSLRLRVATPWDWRQHFKMLDFQIATKHSGQPRVEWEATVLELESNVQRCVKGHIEIRWSHGRFCGMPEAKIYLDTPHGEVPGYFALA